MRIPVTIQVHDQDVPIKGLIDSGAEGVFIHEALVQRLKIQHYHLPEPIQAQHVDGSQINGVQITHFTILPIKVGTKSFPTYILIAQIGEEDLILGHPWLKKNNPRIDWNLNSLSINRINHSETPKPLPLPPNIPTRYEQYSDIFQKKASERFPPSRSYDHSIDLKPDFIPSDCSVYSLTPKERIKHDEFIEENLRKGYIRQSNSPQVSPFFFVGKKDGDLRPCEDYRKLNTGTIRNNYPLPLIADLIDKLSHAKYFTKLDLRNGYNNIRIRDGDQWKAAFKTPAGLFEPMVMFFGLCNSPATFQAFMNDIF